MACSIPAQNLKAFGKGLHALAKIGDDLYLQPLVTGLSLQTINMARSAFSTIKFLPTFFSHYDPEVADQDSQDSDDPNNFKFKVTMKSMVWAFRSIMWLEKTVVSASLKFCLNEDKLKVKFKCKFGVTKTYTISLMDTETLSASYDTCDKANHFTGDSRVLSEATVNFLSNQEEVTLIASQDRFQMKSHDFCLEGDQGKRAVHTELTIQPTEFSIYSIDKPTSITFCLKELKALLGFTSAFHQPLSVDFDSPGKPIIFSMNWIHTCEVLLVMATISEDTNDSRTQSQPISVQNNSYLRRSQSSSQEWDKSSSLNSDENLQGRGYSTQVRPESVAMASPGLTPIPEANEDVINASALDANGDFGTQPPPTKKAKYLFKRCFEATFAPQNISGSGRILAPDSDEEMA